MSGDAPRVNPWLVAIAVMCGTFMEVLDTTVVNVSLPHVAGSLSVTPDEATWALTSYLVANAVILPMAGWLAGRFGRKRLLMLSIGGFTIASLLCGMAPSLTALVVFRVIQGLTGGALQPLSQAVLLETFPPQDRGKAMGFWGLGIVMAPIFGPLLGGWLTDAMIWRWVFYINIPVGIVSLLMTRAYVHDPSYLRRPQGGRIDAIGIGLLALGMASLQLVLDRGEQLGWFDSASLRVAAAVAVLSLGALVWRELTTAHPIVDLRVFLDRTYATGVVLMTTLGFVLYGSLVLLPLFLQTLLGYSSFQAGIAVSPRGIGSAIAMPLIGMAIGRVDPRKLLATGLLVGAITLWWLSRLTLGVGTSDIFWPQFLQGFALGLVFVPLTTITMDRVPRERMGNATSIFNVCRNTGGSIGIAVAAALLSRGGRAVMQSLGTHLVPGEPILEETLRQSREALQAAGADPASAAAGAQAMLGAELARQSAMVSFVHVFRLLAILFVACIPLVLLMRRPVHAKPPAGAH